MAPNTVSLLILCFVALNCANFAVPVGARSLNLIKLGLVGGSNDLKDFQNSFEIESLGKFAVEEQNKKQNGLLEFVKVLKAKEQVVAGKLFCLTLEAIEASHKKTFEAKVWVKPWMNFKQLQEFKHVEGGLSITPSDLGVEQGGHGSGWKSVSTNDPEVQNAAHHAVKWIQQRSNSLSPYKLLKILLAKAKVIEDEAKFNLLLKLRRGTKEEDLDVKVTKDKDGKYYLN